MDIYQSVLSIGITVSTFFVSYLKGNLKNLDIDQYMKLMQIINGVIIAAVGLSLKQENVEKFKEQLEKYADEKITDELLIRKIEIDEEVEKSDLSIENIKELSMLEPFGEANEKPVFLYKNLKIAGIRTLSDGKHIKLSLQDENMFIDVIGFGMGDLANEYELGDKVDVVGNLEINSYNGRESIQILLKDMRKSIGNIK